MANQLEMADQEWESLRKWATAMLSILNEYGKRREDISDDQRSAGDEMLSNVTRILQKFCKDAKEH